MKILIIGANGSVGKAVTKTALDSGHEVTVYVRTPSKMGDLENKVSAIAGGLDDGEKLASAMKGAEAVISCAGAMNNRPGQIEALSNGIRNVAMAMKRHGIRRIVTISGMATPVQGDQVSFFVRILRAAMKRMLPQVVGANTAIIAVLSESGLDWTAVRAGMLNDGPATGKVRADAHLSRGMKISRADLARFMVDQLKSGTFIGQAPMVSAG